MKTRMEFDDIRPYNDDEVVAAIGRLLENATFQGIMKHIFSDEEREKTEKLMRSFSTKYEFQHQVVRKFVYRWVGKTSDTIACSGFENIEKNKTYTYISNHRDIILDASLLCSLLGMNGFDTAEIAIGDNLLLHRWIEDLVRLNKSFIVKRNVSIREMLEVSRHLSKYIHYAINEKGESVWIAQREGRAKNSDDRTQESLLKMLAMGSEKQLVESIEELNITPVTFSYEYDPCDYLKAKEFQQKRDNPDFKKSQEDDFLNMKTGLSGYKGNVHFQIGHSINDSLRCIDRGLKKNELIAKIAALIDKEIFLNYRFYPGNYIAYDRLWGGDFFAEKYEKEDVRIFDSYIQKQLACVDLPNKDFPFLVEKILEMYAYPVKNYLSVIE